MAQETQQPYRMWCIKDFVSLKGTEKVTLMRGNVVRARQVSDAGSQTSRVEVEYGGKIVLVDAAFLNDYVEEFEEDREPVSIPDDMRNVKGAKQYIKVGGVEKHNLCGQFCVAYLVGNDIHSVLRAIQGTSLYNDKVVQDNETDAGDLKKIIEACEYRFDKDFNLQTLQEDWQTEKEGVPVPKFLGPELMRTGLRKMLRTHQLLVLVRSNTGGHGELWNTGDKNHWVVVDALTHRGNRVKIYNPFLNRHEAYSFNEFYFSCTGGNLSGIWVKRRENAPLHPDEEETDVLRPAKPVQYIWVENGEKSELCGEFSVAYILTKSVDGALWYLTKNRSQPSAELETLLKNSSNNDCVQLEGNGLTIRTVLESWKQAQRKLYDYHVGKDIGTGLESLKSILWIYGYNNPDDLIDFPGTSFPSPGEIKKKLEKYFLIVGVGIDKVTGELKQGSDATRHWEVLEEIHPVGRHYLSFRGGGNGGWVKLYNPFWNRIEEYSFRELTDTMGEDSGQGWLGLWVKRKIQPRLPDKIQIIDPASWKKDDPKAKKKDRPGKRGDKR